MKILCCGSRSWTDVETVASVLQTFPANTTIVHGAQASIDYKTGLVKSGADWICGEVAKQLSFRVKPYPADWSIGKQAGILRNRKMLSLENCKDDPIVLCLAFHDDLDLGRGTRDMVSCCTNVGIPTRVVRSSAWHKDNGDRVWP